RRAADAQARRRGSCFAPRPGGKAVRLVRVGVCAEKLEPPLGRAGRTTAPSSAGRCRAASKVGDTMNPSMPPRTGPILERLRVAYVHYLFGADNALRHVEQFAAAARRLGHQVDVHAMNPAPLHSNGHGRTKLAGALKRRLRRYLHEPKEL